MKFFHKQTSVDESYQNNKGKVTTQAEIDGQMVQVHYGCGYCGKIFIFLVFISHSRYNFITFSANFQDLVKVLSHFQLFLAPRLIFTPSVSIAVKSVFMSMRTTLYYLRGWISPAFITNVWDFFFKINGLQEIICEFFVFLKLVTINYFYHKCGHQKKVL